jgi:biotin carboxylase
MVVNNLPYILAVTDKLTTGSPHFVEMGHSQQSSLPEIQIAKIHDLASRAVKAVGISEGPAHVEIMLTSGGPKMIELGARLGGDCITSHLVPLSTGIDMVKAMIDVSLGLKPDITPLFNKGSAIRYFDIPEGIIKNITGIAKANSIEGVKEVVCTKNIGDKLTDIHCSLDRAGFVIAQSDTCLNAVRICDAAIKTIHIITEN